MVGTVVGVWAEVGRWSLTPTELSQFLALFKAPNPPLVSELRLVLLLFGVIHRKMLRRPCARFLPDDRANLFWYEKWV